MAGHTVKIKKAWAILPFVLLAACGGGGGGDAPIDPPEPPGPVVVENRPPIVVSNAITHASVGQVYEYDVEAIDPDTGDVLRYSLSESPAGMAVDAASGLISWSPGNNDIGNHPVTVVVTDGDRATGTQSFTLSVAGQDAGVRIISAAITNATEDQAYRYDVNAEGGETSAPYVFSLEQSPQGMTIAASSGLIEWTPSNQNVGSHVVAVVATDAAGDTDRQSFNVVVVNVNDPPSITWTPNLQVNESEQYQHTVTASDVDSGDSLRFRLTAAPSAMSIGEQSGQLSWTPQASDIGNHTVTVEVRDQANATDTLTFTLRVLDVNVAPTIASLPTTAAVVDTLFTYRVIAIDPDPGNSLDFALLEKPNGMQIDASGLITWVPASAQSGTHRVRVRTTDSGTPSASADQMFVLYVLNTIPKTAWSLHYVDSQDGAGNAQKAFDGDPATIWHSEWRTAQPPPPHEIQINLGALHDVGGFRYVPRQDTSVNGLIKDYEFYVSEDGVNWGTPVAAGRFENSKSAKSISFPLATARYVRFVALNEVNDAPWTSAAEFDVVGAPFSGNHRPNGVIDSPAGNQTINVGDSVIFSGTSVDRDNDLPLATVWTFGDSGVADQWQQNAGPITFNQPGTFVVTMTTVDATGRIDSTPAQRIIKVRDSTYPLLLDQTQWSLHHASSAESTAVDGKGVNAFDGNVDTNWVTSYSSATPPSHPHEIQINLGSAYSLDGLRYLPRQDDTLGNIKGYRLFVSENGVDWGAPVAIGGFAGGPGEKQILFPPKTGQFVRLLTVSGINGTTSAAAAEINIEGECHEPFVHIVSPRPYHIQSTTSLSVTASVCLDPNLHAGWGVKFVLDGGATVTDALPPYEAVFNSVSPGEHELQAFIVTQQGTAVDGADAFHQIGAVGIGKYYVALGDSISFGVGDDDSSDDFSQDGRNFDGGYPPILNDLLTAATGRAYTVSKEKSAVPGITSSGMLARMSSVVAANTGADAYLIQLGTNDGGGSLPVPSGLGLNPGDAGYAGSLKDNLQRIIDIVRSAGAQAYLAKLPYAIGDAQYDARLQSYNAVVDELVLSNGITVTPPDFYNHFKTNQNQLTADNLHPNGAGYKAMAALWLNALSGQP